MDMEQLAAETIAWHPASFADGTGRVFTWNGGIYRAIAPDAADHVRALLANAHFRALQDRGAIVGARVAPISVPGAAFVLEHPCIPFVTYAHEWAPEMLRDAALRTLEVAEEMLEEGIVLQDATSRNVVFDGSTPVFVDIGSFVRAPNDVLWAPYEQFCATFLFPLVLADAGCGDAARALLAAHPDGIPLETFTTILPMRARARRPLRYAARRWSAQLAAWIEAWGFDARLRAFAADVARTADLARGRRRIFASLRRELEGLSFSRVRSLWSTYETMDLPHRNDAADVRKEAVVAEALERLRPSNIMDVGCNAGRYALRAAHVIPAARIIAMDNDAAAVAACYASERIARANILPVVMDVLNPSPARGWCGRECPPATERLRADAVLALAILHHLSIVRRQGFARALDALEAFASDHVIVEFVGPRDPMVARLMRQSRFTFPWYTEEEFLRTVHARSPAVTIADPHAPDRRLVSYAIPHR